MIDQILTLFRISRALIITIISLLLSLSISTVLTYFLLIEFLKLYS